MKLYRDTIWIDPADRDRLGRAALDTPDRILKCIGDQIVAWSRSTDTVRADLPPAAGGGAVFIKRYHHLRWRKRIKAAFRGAFFGRSRARAEFDQLRRLRERGAPVVRPVAYGERRIAHFLRSSFLVTEGVADAVSLTTFAQHHAGQGRTALGFRQRRRLIESLGRCIGDFHRKGLVHGALFWRNVLVRQVGPDRFEFVLLDAPGRKRLAVFRSNGHRDCGIVGDLASLAATAPEFCTSGDMACFFHSYLDMPRLDASHRQLARSVLACACPLREHELYRLRMNRIFHYHLVPSGPEA